MGQAKNRGSYDERKALALEEARLKQEERDRKEMELELIKAEKWAKLTPEQKEARLKKAKNEVEMLALFASFSRFGNKS